MGDLNVAVSQQDVLRWVNALQQVFAENREMLTNLDLAVGDGDLGISLDRGFTAVQAELSANPPTDLRSVFQNVATILIRTMGGTSGPLLGTFFLRAGAACAGKSELAPADVVALFQAGVEGIQQRGKAALGDKTMLDALLPAVDAMRGALEAGSSLTEILDRAAAAAEAGMRATIPMSASRIHKKRSPTATHETTYALKMALLVRAKSRPGRFKSSASPSPVTMAPATTSTL